MKKRYTKPLTIEEMLQVKDEDIDTSDIPEIDEEWFKRAKLVMPQNKESITLRLDKSVLDYFKAQGKGYQTRINALLKTYVEAQQPATH
jgi:uncharacterized protein (DUF4415 family)